MISNIHIRTYWFKNYTAAVRKRTHLVGKFMSVVSVVKGMCELIRSNDMR